MHYSGIVIVSSPARFEESLRGLEALDGLEVHASDPKSGRIVAVQETASLEEQQAALRRIQALPHVTLAAPVYHYVDREDATVPDGAAESGKTKGAI
jgi:nitrate reductase NapAB chaperone NapD